MARHQSAGTRAKTRVTAHLGGNAMRSQKTARAFLLLVPFYVPVLVAGTWLSVRLDVGYLTGSDPSADLFARGTALSPPLLLVSILLAGSLLAQRRGSVGIVGATLAGFTGFGLLVFGSGLLPGHLAVARSVGAPESTTIVLGVLTALFGLCFSTVAVALLGRSARKTKARSPLGVGRRLLRA